MCCPIIVENKRAPTRASGERVFQDGKREQLEEAISGLKRHCIHYFEMFPRSKSVIAIAASGPYWVYKVINYSDTLEADIISSWNNPSNVKKKDPWSRSLWSKEEFEIGTARSNEKLESFRKKLKRMPKKPRLLCVYALDI